MEYFPDIIVVDNASMKLLRVITDRAATWLQAERGIDMKKYRRSTLAIEPSDELLVDAYVSGLTLRTREGYYFH